MMMLYEIFEEAKTNLTGWNQFLDEEYEDQKQSLFIRLLALIPLATLLFSTFPNNPLVLLFIILLQAVYCMHSFSLFAELVVVSQQILIIENHLSDKDIEILREKGISFLIRLRNINFIIIASFIVIILILFEKNFILTLFH